MKTPKPSSGNNSKIRAHLSRRHRDRYQSIQTTGPWDILGNKNVVANLDDPAQNAVQSPDFEQHEKVLTQDVNSGDVRIGPNATG